MDTVDHVWVAHPRDAALSTDISRHSLESHHGDRAGVLGDLGLLRGDHVHDHPAFEHFGHTALDTRAAGRGASGVVIGHALLDLFLKSWPKQS
jgi:hypothetical protein